MPPSQIGRSSRDETRSISRKKVRTVSSGKPKVVPVSELFDRLVAEYPSANVPHSILFQTALRACAEDSKRVHRGEPPAPITALVERARAMLGLSHPGSSPPALTGWGPEPTPVSGGPIRFVGQQAPLAPEALLDALPPETAAPVPETHTSAALSSLSGFEFTPEAPVPSIAEEMAPALPAPVVSPLPAPLEAEPPEPPVPVGPASAPFEEHAEPISPVLQLHDSGISFEDLFGEEGDTRPENAPPEGRGASSLVFRIGMVALALLAGAVAIVVLWPGLTPRKSVPPRIVESFPAPQPAAVQPPLAATPIVPTPEPAAPPTSAPAPRPTQRPAETTAPAQSARAARPVVVEGVETMRSPDWAGHAPTFVVHFASYRSRLNATADAARLGRETGRPARALLIDLGEKGTWYRVVVGDFATADEARAFRAGVAVRKTSDVGAVYRLAAP
jgi:hypothetical protein